jgi:DNA polymerase III subunit epsilon
MTKRDIVVVDFETTGLGLKGQRVHIVEAAAINLNTGEHRYFVPELLGAVPWSEIDPIAMKINGYFERELWTQELGGNATRAAYADLREFLRGNVFAGSNPAFDERLLLAQGTQTWFHRKLDLASYAAGKLGIEPWDLQGLDGVAKLMGVDIAGRHGALEDAEATGKLIKLLRDM